MKMRTLDWLLGGVLASLAFGVAILAVELQRDLSTDKPEAPPEPVASDTSADGDAPDNPPDADAAPDEQPEPLAAESAERQQRMATPRLFPFNELRGANVVAQFPIVLAAAAPRRLPSFIDLNQERITLPPANGAPENKGNESVFTAPAPPPAIPEITAAGTSGSSSSSSSSSSSDTTPTTSTTSTTTSTTSTTTTTTTTTTIPNNTESGAGL